MTEASGRALHLVHTLLEDRFYSYCLHGYKIVMVLSTGVQVVLLLSTRVLGSERHRS